MSTSPQKLKPVPREDTNPTSTTRTGVAGIFESGIRKFKMPMMLATILTLFAGIACLLGLAVAPAIALITSLFEWSELQPVVLKYVVRGVSLVLGFMTFGFSAILVVPLANKLVLPSVGPFRGPYYSAGVLGWFIHNTLTYALRYTFLDWVTPTPFNLYFYRQMGMKIGKRVEINTTNVSDPALITLEDGVTIGGSATIIAHYAMGGYLILAPVVIRKNATIGLRAVIMGGVEIGEGAKILPNSVILPKTIVPAGETWAGVPAKCVT